MVRKIIVALCCASLLFALGVGASAATHEVYENGNISSTYVTYFRDIVSGLPFADNYVAFRSGQYEYTMVTGKLSFDNGVFALADVGTSYVFRTDSNTYNSQYRYYVQEIQNFSLNVDDEIIYSDLGQYPQLVERGAKYEMLTAVLGVVAFLGVVIGRFFRVR